MNKDYLKIATRNLKTRSLRSWLTILGIVIGVFLVISLISLGTGIEDAMLQQLNALGGEMVFIYPGDISNPFVGLAGGILLEAEDIRAVERTKGVEAVISTISKGGVVKYKNEAKTIFLQGISWDTGLELLKDFQGWSLAEGDWPSPGKRDMLVGRQVAGEMFKDMEIGSEATVQGKKFKVVGILNSLGNKNDDSAVFLDLDVFYGVTGEKRGTAQMAMVKIKEGYTPDEVAENIKEALSKTRKRRQGSDENDFSVITSEKITGLVGDIMGMIQAAVLGLASIAIIVGGIGITNTMYTSVKERTREIGIMKAIGAKSSHVVSIFLMEAGIIGLIGGAGGTLLGFLMAQGIEIYARLHPSFYLRASISPGLIIFGLLFSFALGCLAGLLPARRAAKLKPVDALRYE